VDGKVKISSMVRFSSNRLGANEILQDVGSLSGDTETSGNGYLGSSFAGIVESVNITESK
jgi:hypothetical protein